MATSFDIIKTEIQYLKRIFILDLIFLLIAVVVMVATDFLHNNDYINMSTVLIFVFSGSSGLFILLYKERRLELYNKTSLTRAAIYRARFVVFIAPFILISLVFFIINYINPDPDGKNSFGILFSSLFYLSINIGILGFQGMRGIFTKIDGKAFAYYVLYILALLMILAIPVYLFIYGRSLELSIIVVPVYIILSGLLTYTDYFIYSKRKEYIK